MIDTAWRRVCPLYSFDDRDRVHLIGSAVPFVDDGFHFLIAAAHTCFRDGKPTPLFVYGAERPHALTGRRGAWEYRKGASPDLDVAVVELSEACASDMQALYWFSTTTDVAVAEPKTPSIHYLIAGYPSSRNRSKPAQFGLPSRATALVTGDICSVATLRTVDKSDDSHFGLSLPYEKVPSVDGGKFHVPKPQGMSGGGVWRLKIDTRTRLADTLSLVGIGIEYHRLEQTFIATRIQAVAPLAKDLVELCKADNV